MENNYIGITNTIIVIIVQPIICSALGILCEILLVSRTLVLECPLVSMPRIGLYSKSCLPLLGLQPGQCFFTGLSSLRVSVILENGLKCYSQRHLQQQSSQQLRLSLYFLVSVTLLQLKQWKIVVCNIKGVLLGDAIPLRESTAASMTTLRDLKMAVPASAASPQDQPAACLLPQWHTAGFWCPSLGHRSWPVGLGPHTEKPWVVHSVSQVSYLAFSTGLLVVSVISDLTV